MNLVPDSKITATQKIVDKRYTISHIFTWALNDFWIVKRLSIGIPLKKPKNRAQLRLEFWSKPQHYNNETESKTKQYFQIFFLSYQDLKRSYPDFIEGLLADTLTWF